MVRFSKKILSNFLIYTIGSVLLKGSSFILIPLLMRTVSPSDIGLLSLMNNCIALVSVIIALGLRQAISIEYFHKNPTEQKAMLVDISLLYSIIAPITLIALYYNKAWINIHLFAGYATDSMLALCLLQCFCSFFSELVYQVLMYRCQALFLTIVQLAAAAITFTISLYSVYYTNWAITGILLGNLVGIISVCAVGLFMFFSQSLYQHCSLRRMKQTARYYIFLGLPFIPSVLAGWALISINRWLIAAYCSLHDVGIYSVVDMGHNLFRIFILYPISGAYLPPLLKKFALNKQSPQKLYLIDHKNKKIMWLSMCILTVTIAVGYTIGKPLAHIILPQLYHQALPWLLLLAAANIFLMGTYFTTCYLQFLKKSIILAGSLFVTALIAVALSYLLIPCYGIPGGLLGLLIAYILYFLAILYINNYFHTK